MIALENGIIEPDNSIRTWSGEIFWNEDWNKDIDFCVYLGETDNKEQSK